MFPITVTVNTPAELNAVMAALGGPTEIANSVKAGAEAPPAAPKAAKAAAAPSPTTASAAAAPVSTVAVPNPVAASAATASSASIAVTYDGDVKPLVLKINTTKGREAARDALAKFGVEKAPDLKPEQYADFVAHAKKILGAEAAS